MVLGGSSSAPNLQDYARTHRKKLTSSGFLDDATRGSAVKRFSISFARHPTNGFELYSMVPSICPLETLHNSLSLKQVDEFLSSVAVSSSEMFLETPTPSPASAVSYSGITNRKTSLNTFTPAKILPSPFSHSANKKAADRASVVSSGLSSTVLSAGPSSLIQLSSHGTPDNKLLLQKKSEENETPPGP
ncbi:inositol hexakisphosphate and diphosphoinositol-pentakisphosphate kinase 2-like [Polyodon spathula]|nr:inositol hexakisphosphate and diphosphoinositol-pentakisphosphate kinase 2-like [Polyodon spathula]